MYFKSEPLYPFGYGLSYTTFEYSNVRTSAEILGTGGEVAVSVDVKNTGGRDGDEVVQMYVRHIDSKMERPLKELQGLKRVSIPSKESRTVTFTLKESALAYWDSTAKAFATEEDNVEIQLGASSADIKVKKTIGVVNRIVARLPHDFGLDHPGQNIQAVTSIRLLRKNASWGMGLRLATEADVDMRLYDLKGTCVDHIPAGKLTKGDHYIPLTRVTLGAAVYIVSGTIQDRQYSAAVLTH
jgi:hypothetical protein